MPQNVVQFTRLKDFIADLQVGNPVVIYHHLIEQTIAQNDHGMTRCRLVTVIRAIVAGRGSRDHIARLDTLAFAHGAPVDKLYGRLFGPPGEEERVNRARWDTAQMGHGAILYTLYEAMVETDLAYVPAVNAIVHVDVPLIFADDAEAREVLTWERGEIVTAFLRFGLTDQADRLQAEIVAGEQDAEEL